MSAAARKLALYAKMTGGTPPSAKAEQVVDVEVAKAKDEGRVQAVAGDEEVQKDEGGDEDVVMDPATASQSRPAATRASSATKPKAPSAFDDPEEQEYAARNAYIAAQAKRNATVNGHGGNGQIAEEDECAVDDEDMEDDEDQDEREGERVDEAPMVHLQEIVEGLWVGDLVSAMDTDGLKARGIVSACSASGISVGSGSCPGRCCPCIASVGEKRHCALDWLRTVVKLVESMILTRRPISFLFSDPKYNFPPTLPSFRSKSTIHPIPTS